MKRDGFGSRIGVLAAAAGSAIGLGNIWKFPYITGENGGAAFILVYLACIALIGLPVMITEFALGRKAQTYAGNIFKKLVPNKSWNFAGYLGIATSFITLSFYAVIAGWVFEYLGRSASGALMKVMPDQLGDYFGGIISAGAEPILWALFVVVATAFIALSGVKDGIEKYSKVLMPVLLLLLVGLMIRSVTLEGASKGLEFLFQPDFSKLSTKGVLEALGHAFFSLSLGMGIILTYGSYIDKKEDIVKLSVQVTIADTVIALMAGVVIFPAVFANGLEPAAGPGLIFITLPAVFQSMPLGNVFSTLFFLLVGIAALTSTVSLLEVSVATVTEKFEMNRKKATVFVSIGLFLVSILSNLSYSSLSDFTILGKTFFDLFDFIASYVFLPLGGILVCIFTGWIWGTDEVIKEITSDGLYEFKYRKLYDFIIKVFAPGSIGIILLNSTGLLSKWVPDQYLTTVMIAAVAVMSLIGSLVVRSSNKTITMND